MRRDPSFIGRAALVWCLLSLGAGVQAAQEQDLAEVKRLTAMANELDLALAGAGGEAVPAGSLRVRLAFEASVDLDLFVTGPDQETVYFANTPTHAGGELRADARCGDPAPRIEQVVFPVAKPGVYRVGVDFPRRCDDQQLATSLVVEVVAGARRQTERRTIAPGRFVPKVLEFNQPALP